MKNSQQMLDPAQEDKVKILDYFDPFLAKLGRSCGLGPTFWSENPILCPKNLPKFM